MRPDGDGGLRRSSPLRGSPPFSGANAGSTLHPHPGIMTRYVVVVKTLPAMKIAEKLVDSPSVGVLITGKYISDRNSN